MENPQKIGIGCLTYIVSGLVITALSMGIVFLVPSLKSWVSIIVILPIIAGLVYWYKNHVMDSYDHVREEHTPWWYQARLPIAIGLAASLLPALLLGGLNGAFDGMSSRATVHFDNGTSAAVSLQYKDKDDKWSEISIPAGEAKELKIIVSDSTKISLNGKERILKVASSSDKIFNIDTANTYIRTEITYGKSESDKSEEDDKTQVIKDEFFDVNADHVFKAPETIYTKRRSGDKTRTVVYRMKDMLREMMQVDDSEKALPAEEVKK
jgi:uncharacterized protein YxeA